MKVLVCGDRNWKDQHYVFNVLDRLEMDKGPFEIIEGCARGADRFAEKWAKEHDAQITHFPADWDTYGKAAGPIRNQKMLEASPDLVLAFHENLLKSKGTADMVARSRKAGINTAVFPILNPFRRQ